MQTQRPRIDLDGVSLNDEANPFMTIATFRNRTTAGVVLNLPESADVTVAWSDIEEARLDLGTGELRIQFRPEVVASSAWMRGARVLVGKWLDRFTMTAR